MAVIFTRNLKLRKDSNLSADAKYNLDRIDQLGAVLQTNINEAAVIRSQTTISIEPNSSDVGGSGTGGTVNLGNPNQPIGLVINASTAEFASGVQLKDEAVTGTFNLSFNYKSDINGAVNTSGNRKLYFDLQGTDRNLTIGADIIFNADLNFPSSNGGAGQVLSTDGAGTLSWISGNISDLNSLTDTAITSPVNNDTLTYNGSAWVNTPAPTVASFTADWLAADSSVKIVNHNLGSKNVIVQVYDPSNSDCTLEVDDVCRTSINQVTLTASTSPGTSWKVLILKI